jgi:hypothetical protein
MIRTVTAAGPVTTVTTTTTAPAKTVVPKGCHEAISAARQFANETEEALSDAEVLPELPGRAAKAAEESDTGGLEGVTAQLKDYTSKTEALAPRVKETAYIFKEAASHCH